MSFHGSLGSSVSSVLVDEDSGREDPDTEVRFYTVTDQDLRRSSLPRLRVPPPALPGNTDHSGTRRALNPDLCERTRTTRNSLGSPMTARPGWTSFPGKGKPVRDTVVVWGPGVRHPYIQVKAWPVRYAELGQVPN